MEPAEHVTIATVADLHERRRWLKTDEFCSFAIYLDIARLAKVINLPFSDKTSPVLVWWRITRSSPQWWWSRSTTPHDVLNLWSPICNPSVWGYMQLPWVHGSRGMALSSPPASSYYLPIHRYGLSLTVFELFNWLKKHFCPPVQPGYDDKYRPGSYRFVVRQQ